MSVKTERAGESADNSVFLPICLLLVALLEHGARNTLVSTPRGLRHASAGGARTTARVADTCLINFPNASVIGVQNQFVRISSRHPSHRGGVGDAAPVRFGRKPSVAPAKLRV
jgi:hypothetical protein